MNSADTLAGGFPNKEYSSGGSSIIKKVLIGVTAVACLAIIVIVIAVAAAGGAAEEEEGKCPNYYYKDTEKALEINGDEEGSTYTCVLSKCDFRSEIMTDDNDCEKCDEGETPDATGKHCLKDDCKPYQFLNQDALCEECPDAYLKAAGKCYQSDRNKIDMVQVFQK
jgi:hypothetical protein